MKENFLRLLDENHTAGVTDRRVRMLGIEGGKKSVMFRI